MECALLPGRALSGNAATFHRGVEHAAQERGRGDVAGSSFTLENESGVRRLAALAPPPTEKFDEIGREVDVATLVVLRGCSDSAGVAVADTDRSGSEVDVSPGEREQFALAHSGLQRE